MTRIKPLNERLLSKHYQTFFDALRECAQSGVAGDAALAEVILAVTKDRRVAIAAAIAGGRQNDALSEYDSAVRSSWIATELKKVQNAEPLVAKWGGDLGTILAGADMWLRTLFGFGIWKPMKHHTDASSTQRADLYQPIDYPKPDGVISFDRLSSVALSFTNHEEDQPCHLRLADPAVPLAQNLPKYAEPAQRYCPAAVYEIAADAGGAPVFRINAANCIHCKTCEIKDPAQNITWVPPEGGSGPNYVDM